MTAAAAQQSPPKWKSAFSAGSGATRARAKRSTSSDCGSHASAPAVLSRSTGGVKEQSGRRCANHATNTPSVLDSIAVLGAAVPSGGRAAGGKAATEHSATTDYGSETGLKRPRSAIVLGSRQVPPAWIIGASEDHNERDAPICSGRRYAGYVSHHPIKPRTSEPALASTTVTSESFIDRSGHKEVLRPAETIYDVQRYRDALVAAAGCDPRRSATAAQLEAKHGLTEHRKTYQAFTPEEMANALGTSPALEAKRRSVEEVYRRVHERAAAAARSRMQLKKSQARRAATAAVQRSQSAAEISSTAKSPGNLVKSNSATSVKGQKEKDRAKKAQQPQVAGKPSNGQGEVRKTTSSTTAQPKEESGGKLSRKPLSLTDLLKAQTEADGRLSFLTPNPPKTAPNANGQQQQVTVSKATSGVQARAPPPPPSKASSRGNLDATAGVLATELRAAEEAASRTIEESDRTQLPDKTFLPFQHATEAVSKAVAAAVQQQAIAAQHSTASRSSTSKCQEAKKVAPPSIVPELTAIIAAYKGEKCEQGASMSDRSTAAPSPNSAGMPGTSRSLASVPTPRGCAPSAPAARPVLNRPKSAGASRAEPPPSLMDLTALPKDTSADDWSARSKAASVISACTTRSACTTQWARSSAAGRSTAVAEESEPVANGAVTATGATQRRRPASAAARMRTTPAEAVVIAMAAANKQLQGTDRSAGSNACGAAHQAVRARPSSSSGIRRTNS